MKISVIIPTYKPDKYIWQCLISVKQQTLSKSEFEIIIILNGCKEPFMSQISTFIQSELKGFLVTFIQTDIPGVSNARNMGLDCAQGDYIAFVDDDDYISPTYLESLFDHIGVSAVSVSNMLAFDDQTGKIVAYPITEIFNKISVKEQTHIMNGRTYMSVPVAKLINRADIDNRRFDCMFKNGEDSLFMLSISDKIKYLRPASKEAIYYRRYRQNSAYTRKKKFYEIFVNRIKLTLAYLPFLFQPWRYNFLFCLSRIVAQFK